MNNFTPRALQTLAIAKVKAINFNQSYVGTEHLLLGLLELFQGVAINVLNKLGVDLDMLTNSIENHIQSGNREVYETSGNAQDPQFSPQAKAALEFSAQEAKALGHSYIGTEHILMGLLNTSDCLAEKILHEFNVSTDACRKEILAELNPNYIHEDSDSSNDEKNDMDDEDEEDEDDEDDEDEDEINTPGKGFHQSKIPPPNFSEPSAFQSLYKRKKENVFIKTPALKSFGRDLTERASKNELDPVIGRDKEISRVVQILCRRTKNNPVLIGEAGVGKTAIVEGLAQLIAEGKAPEPLLNKRIITLDLALMVAGTKYRGQFEERLKTVMDEIRRLKNVIVFLDELHTIVGAGSAEGAMDASNILKPALSRGEIQCVGATTVSEYRKHIEKDGALERRFQSVKVDPPSVDESVLILKGVQKKYEDHHKVVFSEKAIESAVKISDRYITGRSLPDKAIDVLDEAGSRCRIDSLVPPPSMKQLEGQIEEVRVKKEEAINKQSFEEAAKFRDEEKALKLNMQKKLESWEKKREENRVTVNEEDIIRVVASWTGIPLNKMQSKETKQLLSLEKELQAQIIGQDQATSVVARALRRSRADLKDPKRPIGSFLFLGPTGVGKTFLAKLLAEKMFGQKEAIIQIDMSEYMEKFTVSRMIGSPPGYVGHDEGGQLTEMVRRKPYSVILFDEIEKAHPDVAQILLQVLEEGRLTDSLGRIVDFRNTIIIMTSNTGAEFLQKDCSLGFGSGSNPGEDFEKVKEHIQEATKKAFKPEFLNRIGELVIFRQLQKEDLSKIVELELNEIQKRLESKQIKLKISSNVKTFLIDKGYDKKYGARPLKRTIERFLEDPLAEEILKGSITPDHPITVNLSKDKTSLTFSQTK